MDFHRAVCYYKHKMNPEQHYQNGQPDVPPTNNQPYAPQQAYTPQPVPVRPAEYGPLPNGHTDEPVNGSGNPYEFIFAEQQHHKQTASSGGSMVKRVLVIVGGLVVLAVVAAIVMSLLAPKDTSLDKLTSVLQEQQEIVRIANLSDTSATSIDLKNLAVNVSLSVGTNATSMQNYLSERNIKITETLLAAKQDTKTDTLFTNAKSTNTFDRVAAQTMQSLLVTYRSNLNTTYQDVKGANARKELQSSYQTAEILIAEANKVVGQ